MIAQLFSLLLCQVLQKPRKKRRRRRAAGVKSGAVRAGKTNIFRVRGGKP